MSNSSRPEIETHPLTPDRWSDFAELMNARFDTRRCWCMWPRLATNYNSRSAESNRRSMKRRVDTGRVPPGVLAYIEGVPAGWCAVAPRGEYPKLDRSRVTAPLDDQPVWSVVCFLVRRDMRGHGLSRVLLAAAVELAGRSGAKIIEGYPVENTRNLFRGVTSVFDAVGFQEVARRSANRPLMRYQIGRRRRTPPSVRKPRS